MYENLPNITARIEGAVVWSVLEKHVPSATHTCLAQIIVGTMSLRKGLVVHARMLVCVIPPILCFEINEISMFQRLERRNELRTLKRRRRRRSSV